MTRSSGKTTCELCCDNVADLVGDVPNLPGFEYYRCCQPACQNYDSPWIVCKSCETGLHFNANFFRFPKSNREHRSLIDHIRSKRKEHEELDGNIAQNMQPPPKRSRMVRYFGEDDNDDDEAEGEEDEGDSPAYLIIPDESAFNEEEEDGGLELPAHEKIMFDLQIASEYLVQKQQMVMLALSQTAQVARVLVQENPSLAEEEVNWRTQQSLEHFENAKNFGQFHAIATLVAKALYEGDCEGRHIEPYDVAKFYLLVKNIWMLPKKGRQHIAPLLGLFHSSSQNVSFLGPNMISTMRDIGRLVTRNKFAFIPNLPHPSPIKLPGENNEGVYISVVDSIAHLLHSDFVPHFDCIPTDKSIPDDTPVRHFSQCNAAREKFDHAVDYNLILRTWQDGFEANYNKANRLKVWIKTGTLSVAEAPGAMFLSYPWRSTFPIAMGYEKGEGTKAMENAFYKDMEVLGRPGGMNFYHGGERRVVKVAVHLLIVGGDQPERRGMCGLTGVNGLHGPGFGCIGNYKAIWKNIPSCRDCLGNLLEKKAIVEDCDKCLNWDVYRDNTDLNLYDPPDFYPKGAIPQGQTKLKFRRVTFDLLKAVANEVHENIVDGTWKDMNKSAAYLDAHAINTKTKEGIIRAAQRVKMYNESVNKNDANKATIEEFYLADPGRYQKYELPPIWDSPNVTIENVVCLIMHLLFLGMGKHMFEEIYTWLGTQGKREAFIQSADGILECICKMNLPWCKVLPYNKGTGGSWVSENYLAMVKLMPWFFSMLDMVKVNEKDMEIETRLYDPAKPKCWPKKDCEVWLKHRNLSVKGKAAEIQERVWNLQTQEGGPPAMHINEPSASQVQLCLQSLTAMISRLMSRETTKENIHAADCYVRIFLSYYSKYDDAMKNKHEGKPSWVSHANFLSLPRLIEQMHQFGPLRLTWEGGIEGEGALSRVKPEIKGGDKKNWSYNCTLRILRTAALDGLECCHELREMLQQIAPELPRRAECQNGYRKYGSAEEVRKAFFDNKPISGFVTKNGSFGICIGKRGSNGETLGIKVTETQPKRINSMAYHRWELLVEQELQELNRSEVQRCILWLPELCGEGFLDEPTANGFYTVMDEEWHVLDSEKQFDLPVVDSWFDLSTQ